MCGIVTPPRASASARGALGLARRQRAGDVLSESLLNPAPEPGHPPAVAQSRAIDGPPEPADPAKLAEAHAMARRPGHPLHAALMNPIHPDHRHAVAAYEALFRDAYAPAELGPKPAALPGVAARPGADGRMRPLENRVGAPQLAQTSPSAGQQAEQPRPFPLPLEKPDGIDEDIIAFDRARGADDQAAAQVAMMKLPPPYRHGLPPKTFFVSNESYAAMRNIVLALPNLSPKMRYVFMRLLSYEGTPYDSGGGSRGGVSKQAWENAKAIIRRWRKEEGRDTPVPLDVEDLTVEDIFDAMRAYANQEFGEDGVAQFAKIENRELAFQLFDLQYQYGFDERSSVWQDAIDATLAQLGEPRLEKQRLAFEELVDASKAVDDDKTVMQRLALATALSAHEQLRDRFLENLRRAKAAELQDQSKYQGASRARIWGMSREP